MDWSHLRSKGADSSMVIWVGSIAAYRDGSEADEVALYIESMTLETMVAVTAVRSSFHQQLPAPSNCWS